MGVYIAQGFQRLIDAQQRWVRAGHSVYLRSKNFVDQQATSQAVQLGFQLTPSEGTPGTTDILIDPPPSVTMVSMHNIGQSMGKLRIGARYFLISATWVTAQAQVLGLTDESLVFRGSSVLGLVCDNQLFSIEAYPHHEYGGVTLTWILTANAPETIQPGVL